MSTPTETIIPEIDEIVNFCKPESKHKLSVRGNLNTKSQSHKDTKDTKNTMDYTSFS